uniref:Putative secreted protein n=1 Tax=Anopheles marajoara TaxID=58244 RepID=A0A2M4CCC4_9DIPT
MISTFFYFAFLFFIFRLLFDNTHLSIPLPCRFLIWYRVCVNGRVYHLLNIFYLDLTTNLICLSFEILGNITHNPIVVK